MSDTRSFGLENQRFHANHVAPFYVVDCSFNHTGQVTNHAKYICFMVWHRLVNLALRIRDLRGEILNKIFCWVGFFFFGHFNKFLNMKFSLDVAVT